MSGFEGDLAIPPYKDRTIGLVFFGLLELALGCLCLMMMGLVVVACVATPMPPEQAVPTEALIPGLIVYGLLAVVFVWLGVGSILARRWARALSLILGWIWLVLGVFATAFWVVLAPDIHADMWRQIKQPIPAEAAFSMFLIPAMLLGCGYLVLPGLFVLFYSSRHVRATCETRDPRPRWTDRCPLPVLALVLIFGFSAI